MDGALGPLVEQVYEVRSRLCGRLGQSMDTDPDIERLIGGLEKISRVCGKLMYQYGYQDGANAV